MLMPVQFPDYFGIPDFFEIKIPDGKPGFQRCPFAVHNVQMPVNLWPKRQALVAEQIELVFADAFSAPHRFIDLSRQSFSQQSDKHRNIFRLEKEAPAFLRSGRANAAIEGNPRW